MIRLSDLPLSQRGALFDGDRCPPGSLPGIGADCQGTTDAPDTALSLTRAHDQDCYCFLVSNQTAYGLWAYHFGEPVRVTLGDADHNTPTNQPAWWRP